VITEEIITSIPKGWTIAELRDIVELSKEKVNPIVIDREPYIGLEHIEKDTGKLLGYSFSDEVRSTKNKFYKGDLLYGKLRPYLNKVMVAPFDGVCSTDILVFSKNSHVSNDFIAYRLRCNDFVRFASLNVSGVQHPRVDFQTLSKFTIVLPPLTEQHRIVAKIEELFSYLDAGVAPLKKAKAQLKLYRQAVLKAAFEGRLTAAWREAHKSEIEPSSVTLAKIREGKASGRKARAHKPETSINTLGLAELPETWSWALLPDLGELNRGKSKHRPRNDPKLFGGDYPFIQTGDIRKAEIIKEYSQTYNDFGLKQSRLWPENTLCITIAANIAETAILGIKACFPDSIVGFIADERLCLVKYIHYFFKLAKQKLDYYAPATAQKNINLGTLYGVIVPLPSLAEQEQIVRELDYLFSLTDTIEKTIELNFAQSEKLRQSILKKAFRGELVPQNPSDEPASVLLERIKKEKDAQASGGRRRGAGKRSAKLW